MADILKPLHFVVPGVSDTYNLDCPKCDEHVKQLIKLIHWFTRAVEAHNAQLRREHPRCEACSIFMGRGHVESEVAKYCSTCAQSKRRKG